MASLEKCLETLRGLIEMGDLYAIDLAEMAIDEFVEGQDNPVRKIAALNALDRKLLSMTPRLSGVSSEFVTTIFGYIDTSIRALRDC